MSAGAGYPERREPTELPYRKPPSAGTRQRLKRIVDLAQSIAASAKLKHVGLVEAPAQLRLVAHWQQFVGKELAALSMPLGFKEGVLSVAVASPLIRQELYYRKPQLLESVRQLLGEGLVKDLRFVQGPFAKPAGDR